MAVFAAFDAYQIVKTETKGSSYNAMINFYDVGLVLVTRLSAEAYATLTTMMLMAPTITINRGAIEIDKPKKVSDSDNFLTAVYLGRLEAYPTEDEEDEEE